MAGPFVISMRATFDGRAAATAIDETAASVRRVRKELEDVDKTRPLVDAKPIIVGAEEARREVRRLREELAGVGGGTQARIDAALGIGGSGRSTGQAAADIEAYGRELDELRARYSPLFAVERQHKAQLDEIARAHRLGAISTDEMTAAVRRQEAAFDAAKLAAMGQRSAMASGMNTANIAAQFQDIGVTTAMGMSPMQIALQQGTQLSAVFEQLKGSGQSVGAALRSAFLSVISPVSLLTLGVIAVGVAGVQALGSILPKAESATDAIKRHGDAIAKVVEGYDGAQSVIADYFKSVERGSMGLTLQALSVEFDKIRKESLAAQSEISNIGDYVRQLSKDTTLIFDLRQNGAGEVADLVEQFERGEISANGLREEMRRIRLDPTVSAEVHGLAGEIDTAAAKAWDLRDALIAVSHASASIAVDGSLQTALNSMLGMEKSAERFAIDLAAVGATTPSALGQVAADRKRLELADRQDMTEAWKAQEIEQARILAERQAEAALARSGARSGEKADDRWESSAASMRDRIAGLQLEAAALGQTAEQAERASIIFELENDARRAGLAITPALRAEIEGLADAYAKETVQLEELREAQARQREETEFYRSTFSTFFREVLGNAREGQSIWEAFGNSAVGALDRIADRALGMAADGIFDMIFGAVMGGITGGLGGGMGGGGRLGLGLTGANVYGGGNGFYMGAFASGGAGVIPGGSGPADSVLAYARVTPGEPYAFGEAAMRGLRGGAGGNGPAVEIIDQRGAGAPAIRQERGRKADGRETIRLIIRDEVRDAHRRGAEGF